MSPSPWSIRRPTESEVVGCVRKYPSIFAADGFSVCSFGATAKHGKRDAKDTEDDLRVIAAAPELLKVLRDLTARYKESPGNYTPEGSNARQLLAKLEGIQ